MGFYEPVFGIVIECVAERGFVFAAARRRIGGIPARSFRDRFARAEHIGITELGANTSQIQKLVSVRSGAQYQMVQRAGAFVGHADRLDVAPKRICDHPYDLLQGQLFEIAAIVDAPCRSIEPVDREQHRVRKIACPAVGRDRQAVMRNYDLAPPLDQPAYNQPFAWVDLIRTVDIRVAKYRARWVGFEYVLFGLRDQRCETM